MKKIILIAIAILLSQILLSCGNEVKNRNQNEQESKTSEKLLKKILYRSENLIIRRITSNVLQHISFIDNKNSERISCNGMIVIDNGDAVIFDTPTNDQTSVELLDFLTNELNVTINAVIATHFHLDGLGGLQVFHRYGVDSIASNETIKLAQKSDCVFPNNGFDKELILSLGQKKIYLEHLGEGFTKGNIVGYLPEDQILFGGDLIKEMGADKGDLEDANTNAWPKTITGILVKYPELKIVIPGQGKIGGPELLDYTKSLFQ